MLQQLGAVNMKRLLRSILISVNTHHNFQVLECGLFISVKFPFLDTSPDVSVMCTCYSDGICEIKVYV